MVAPDMANVAREHRPYIGGIDPGKSGGFVVIEAYSGKLAGVLRMPIITTRHNHRPPKKPTYTKEIDWPRVAEDWSLQMRYCRRIFIEHIWGAAPAGKGRKDGGASMFKLGYAAGVPFGLILAQACPYHFVTPQTWHKHLNYPKNEEHPKQPSFDLARKLFPESVDEFARTTVDEGVAEAALIAYVGRTFLGAGYGSDPQPDR